MAELYSDLVGQPAALQALRSAARRPVHAYLIVGPAGTGKRAAATNFAAALLCSAGGDGSCDTCRRVLAGLHPDVITVEREGPAISIETAREVTRLALRTPIEGSRKVLVLTDFHLVRDAGPALLKTIEEPPESTIFLILAEYLPPELVTIASRCVRIDFAALAPAAVAEALSADGVDGARALELAEASGGRLDRARLLVSDPEFERRRQAWKSIPERLDGSGATAAVLADELVALLEKSVAPLEARHREELAELERCNARAAEVNGKVGRSARSAIKAGIRPVEERQRREVRRQRTDELRAGLAALAGSYRNRLTDYPVTDSQATGSLTAARQRAALAAIEAIDQASASLAYNPGELLFLQSLLVRLGRL